MKLGGWHELKTARQKAAIHNTQPKKKNRLPNFIKEKAMMVNL